MYELKKKLERHLRLNLLGPGPRLLKKNLPGRGLTKVKKHWCRTCDVARLRDYNKRTDNYLLHLCVFSEASSS